MLVLSGLKVSETRTSSAVQDGEAENVGRAALSRARSAEGSNLALLEGSSEGGGGKSEDGEVLHFDGLRWVWMISNRREVYLKLREN